MAEKKFYAICVPWGQNGYYVAFIIAENGEPLHLFHGEEQAKTMEGISRIATGISVKSLEFLDMENPREYERFHKIIKTCSEQGRDIYRFYKLFHQ